MFIIVIIGLGFQCDFCKANKIDITLPVEGSASSTSYEFIPVSTIIGFSFVAVCLVLLAVAKIMYASSDQYMMNNRYDLVIFKPPTKNSVIGPRRVYTNSTASTHNLNAAAACGFDVSMLNTRNPYTSMSMMPMSNSNGILK